MKRTSILTFLVLDLRLYILNRIAGFNFKGDGLASQRLDEYLHLLGPLKVPRGAKYDVTTGRKTLL